MGRSGDGGGPWLLIGNSRWHWARGKPTGLQCWHESAAAGRARLERETPCSWAAVGALPPSGALPAQRRLGLEAVPLEGLPPWLGIDRALAGWGAWREATGRGAAAVLVADAGTVLSLTRVEAGHFAGGRLMAGAALQWRAMAEGTARLPTWPPAHGDQPDGDLPLTSATGLEDPWPVATRDAMHLGVLEGLAAAIAAAWRSLAASHAAELWLTGGDGPALAPRLQAQGLALRQAPDLALTALADLS